MFGALIRLFFIGQYYHIISLKRQNGGKTMLSDFKWYRKLKKGKWYFVHYYHDPGMRYWMQREPLPNEVIMKVEKYPRRKRK
jgi:hypothetical protein